MASGSLPASATARADQQRFIERQINKTRRQVKFVELGVAGVTLLVGTMAFFLVAALIDHWLMPLSGFGRGALLVVLLGGIGWFVWSVVVPLLRNSINPAYAALTIEHSAPTLKNSLINFLMLRSDRGQTHDVVYEAIEHRAATDLQQVPIDSVIDYSKLIKVGYALAALFAICAAYKVLSPKDPFQTVARVAAPWADIARPSRVQIEEVTPGDAQQFFGDSVTVSATLRGVRANDRTALVFSTADGQVVDQSIDLTPADNGTTFTAVLPAAGQGLQQDVTYRIEAGDAISPDFRLTVVSAPTIIVEKLEYDFPRYSQRARETRERAGDVRALEGTRVTVHARANQPIHAAYIEFDPAANGTSAQQQRVPMQAAGDTATGSFVLELEADRLTPKRGSYQISFMTESGHPGQHPAVHTIDVIRDLPPEVEVLDPKEQTIEVPENSEALVEVRAVDPDYALSRVGIKLISGGKEFADKSLLDGAKPVGQAVSKFQFRPQDYQLKAGTEVAWWATVADNRASPTTGLHEPNTERTKNYFFKIVAADPHAKPKSGDGQREKPMQQGDSPQGDQPPSADNKQNPSDTGPGDMPPPEEQPKPEPMNNDNEKKKKEEQQNDSSEQQGGNSDMPMTGSKSKQSEGGGAGQSGKSDGESEKPMSEQGDGDKKDESGGADAGNSDSKGNPSDKPQQGGKSQGQKPEGASGKEDGANDKSDGATSKQDNPGESGADNNSGTQDQGADNSQPPGDREKPHEGEAFEKALEHMLKQAEREQQNGGKGQPKPEQGADAGKQPTQDDFNKLPQHLKDKLKDLMKKHQEQNGKSSKSDQPPAGLQGDKPQEKSPGGQSNADKQDGGDQQGAKPDAQPGAGKPDEQPMTGSPSEGGADKKQGTGANNERGMGETGKPDEALKTKPEEASNSKEPASDEKRQGGMGTTGQSGAGQASKDKSGAAQAQEANREKPKSQQSADQPPSEDQQAQSPSGSKKQSDSQGGESGDRSGGGKKGPGQSAKAAGNDAAGSNSAADEGAGAAKQSGDGETGTGAGEKKKADGQTGKSGNEAGEGSATQKSKQGDRSGDGGEKTDNEQSPMPAGQDESDGGGKAGDFVTGGGKPSDSTGRSQYADAEGPAAEKAKLDYAKNATDLVLEYLKDQKDNPDQELLDDLGWSKEDLQKFLDRWSEAKREAVANPNAKRDLDEALRSLGLRAGQDKLRRAETRSDNLRGLGDVGPASGPPSKYLDQFRAFKKGAARGK